MKICKDCKKEKELSEFYPRQGDCKNCYKTRVKRNRKQKLEYYRQYDKYRQRYSINRIYGHRYSMMKMSVQGRNAHKRSVEGKELCSRKEYNDWCKKNEKDFLILYKRWKRGGFERKLAPSIDRINNDKGYTIDNIQWLTQSENSKKYQKTVLN